jgi:hypothetical protein
MRHWPVDGEDPARAGSMSADCAIRVQVYDPKYRAVWDEFVARSKNGLFLFERNYLEYHADRFRDHSLMFFQDDQLVALMPANLIEDTLVSHGGLTFGGIISDYRAKTSLILEIFSALASELHARGMKKLIYKAIPHIYHTVPAEEDLYALFLHNARLFRRDVSSTVVMTQPLPFAELRRRGIKRGKSQGVEVERSHDFSRYMAIVDDNLQERHGTHPVHTSEEMELLAARFPENIKLFAAHKNGEMLAGLIIYESRNVAHAQYIGSSEDGKKLGALDCVVDVLLNEIYRGKRYFDFGTCTLDNGRTLNRGLIQNKEGYGARATVYDFYELDVESRLR